MRTLGLFVSIGFVMVAVVGCAGGSLKSFTIRVDSIDVPPRVGATEGLSVRLLGDIGPDGCHRLDEVVWSYREGVVNVQVAGVMEGKNEDSACTGEVPLLDETLVIPPPHQDSVVVRVRQPDGDPLVARVPVDH